MKNTTEAPSKDVGRMRRHAARGALPRLTRDEAENSAMDVPSLLA